MTAARKRTSRAVSRRTVTLANNRQSRQATTTSAAGKKRPIITVNQIAAESMVLIVIPGYDRIAMATAHAITSRILVTCEDGHFTWMSGFHIGPGDRLKTCTTVEIHADDADLLPWVRIELLGALAFQAACHVAAAIAGRVPPYDAKLVIHGVQT